METPFAEVVQDENVAQLVYINFKGKAESLEDAKIHLAMMEEHFGEHKPLFNIADLRNLKKVSREVRDYLGGDEVAKLFSATGLILGSGLSKVIGNLFIKFTRPTIETKMFTDKEQAKKWLLKQRNL